MRVPLVKGPLGEFLRKKGSGLGGLICGGALFSYFNFACLKPVSKRGVSRLRGTFRYTGGIGSPILIRIIAGGNGNCRPTRSGPNKFRKVNEFSVSSNRPLSDRGKFSTRFKGAVYRLTRSSGGVYTVATTVSKKAKLARFSELFGREFFSINVTRRRTMAFKYKLTTGNVQPIFTICSAFLRETCSRLLRSTTLKGLRLMVKISHTKVINSSNRARRNIFSISVLGAVPGAAVFSPTCFSNVEGSLSATVCVYSDLTIIHCPHNKRLCEPSSFNRRGLSCSICKGPGYGGLLVACNELFSCTYGTGRALTGRNIRVYVLGLYEVGPVSRGTISFTTSFSGM